MGYPYIVHLAYSPCLFLDLFLDSILILCSASVVLILLVVFVLVSPAIFSLILSCPFPLFVSFHIQLHYIFSCRVRSIGLILSFSSQRKHFYLIKWKLIMFSGGLLDRSTARYFYKRLKTSLHKPRGNLLENLFSKKCWLKNNLKLLEKKFLSQRSTTPKNGILLHKMAHFQDSSIFQ